MGKICSSAIDVLENNLNIIRLLIRVFFSEKHYVNPGNCI